MLRFRLGRIPVEVQPGHFLMAAVLGLQTFQALPQRIALLYLVAWMALVFFSVLVHELGHALVSLSFGYRPAIQLVFMGGQTHPNAPGPIPWYADVLVTLAGPGFGLAVWGLLLAVQSVVEPSTLLTAQIFTDAIWINQMWSLLNLVPVQPLDGGRVSHAVLTRILGRRGFLAAQIVGVLACGAIISLMLLTRQDSYPIIFLGFFGLRALINIATYFRGSAGGNKDAVDTPLSRATALFNAGRLAEAKQLAENALEADPTGPKLRSGAHHLLGWIALKEGQGRAALDHFAQVQGSGVEKHALAAAFSLVGDEDRALKLWELAYQESKDSTLLHEWAGALIRAGRLEQARKLPGVDMAVAFNCAERVFFIRGDFAKAAQVGVEALSEYPSAETAYDTACSLARAGDSAGSLRLLAQAEKLGFRNRTLAASDSDLASLHSHPDFQHWLSRLGKSPLQ